eukprot:10082749-Ditylum_brightwellii.AAC.1
MRLTQLRSSKGVMPAGYIIKKLRWVIDMLNLHLLLPKDQLQIILNLLKQFPWSRRRAKWKDWESLCGQFCNMTTVLPGGFGLVKHLSATLHENGGGVTFTSAFHDELYD